MSYKIQKIDKDFDGIVFTGTKAIKVPYTLPNEEVDIKKIDNTNSIAIASDFEILELSNNRKKAICKYFTKCGGCKAQHFLSEDYLKHKISNLIHLLEVNKIDYPKKIEILHHIDDNNGYRRRIILSVDNKKIGFKSYRSNNVIDIDFCNISSKKINESILYLRDIIIDNNSKFKIYEIIITDVDENIDILIKAKSKIDINVIDGFQSFFQIEFIKKIKWNNEPLIIKEDINLNYGKYKIPFNSGGFLQAEKFGENAFIDFILSKLNNSRRILDLFCGFGSHAFSLLNSKNIERIECFDIAKSSINAINKYKSSKLNAEVRDLFNHPIDTKYINNFDGIIINPPRIGAFPQVKQIAQSNIQRIVMVYCSVESAIRDLLILIQNDKYKLYEIKVVDQFIYSPHLEILIYFEKI